MSEELYQKYWQCVKDAASNWFCYQLFNLEAHYGVGIGVIEALEKELVKVFPMMCSKNARSEVRKIGCARFAEFCKLHPEIY